MKKASYVSMAIGVFLAAAVAGFGQNLLLNGSIENGSSSIQIDNWTRHFDDTFREDTNSFGFTAAAMKDGDFAVKEFGGDGDLFQTNIPVQASVTYTANGWFYHSSTEDVISNAANSVRMFMHIEWFDSGGSSLGNDYSANHNGTSPADSWNLITLQTVSPVGADHATFHVETDADVGGGSVFGDAFELIPEPSTFALVLLALVGLGAWRKTKSIVKS